MVPRQELVHTRVTLQVVNHRVEELLDRGGFRGRAGVGHLPCRDVLCEQVRERVPRVLQRAATSGPCVHTGGVDRAARYGAVTDPAQDPAFDLWHIHKPFGQIVQDHER